MARIVALIPDLLFGSRVQADLSAAGHQVELLSNFGATHNRLEGVEVLVADLTADPVERTRLVEGLQASAPHTSPRILAFYSHVDVAARACAERAGFDLVVPRSRMAREGASLVEGLLGTEV